MESADSDLTAPRAVKVLVTGAAAELVDSVSELPPLRVTDLLCPAGLDLGRITIAPDLTLYLFGASDSDRSWFGCDELSTGALGAIVLADPQRPDSCSPVVDFLHLQEIPFVVGALGPNVRESAKLLLIALVEQVMATVPAGVGRH